MIGLTRVRTFILSLCAVLIFVAFLLILGSPSIRTPARYDYVPLDDGWTVFCGQDTWKPDDITEFSIGVADNGKEIILQRTLPRADLDPAAIHFRTILSSVEVQLDNETIYSFGNDYVKYGKMLPKTEHFIMLPPDFAGKELTIIIISRADNSFSGFSPITLGNYGDISNELIHNDRFSMVFGIFLMVFGCLLLILSPFLALSVYHDYSIIFSSLLSLMLGCYIMCYNDMFWVFSSAPSFYTFLEYFTLYMIPGCILGFIIAAKQATYRTLGIVLMCVNIAFALITTLLHVANLVHINHFLSFLHLLAVPEGTFMIVALSVSAFKKAHDKPLGGGKVTSTNMLILGLILMLICAVVEIMRFNILKYSSKGEVNSNISFLTIGAFVFVLCLLLNYFYHCVEYISESTIKSHLVGLAYTDALTGISNRARCEQVLAELSGAYTIISMDLDYLKYTNDNYGHSEGDKLISGFSEILKNSFTDALLVGRMGGDEFIVVLPFVDEDRTTRDLNCLTDQLDHRNSTETRLRFSASWGCATSKDKELPSYATAQNVYLLADQRMYVMKNKHHNQSLGRLYDDLLNKMLGEGGKDNE